MTPKADGQKAPRVPNRELYQQALLALWAGDFDHAEKHLVAFLKAGYGRLPPKTVPAESDPVSHSAQRLLRQLRRRRNEFSKMLVANDMDPDSCLLSNPLSSAGGHLRGLIWREDLLEFEFRVYLADLSWEQGFYRAIDTRLSETRREKTQLYTMLGQEDLPIGNMSSETLTYEAQWTRYGSPFMISRASDFGTITAAIFWTSEVPLTEELQISKPCQELLDELDPADR